MYPYLLLHYLQWITYRAMCNKPSAEEEFGDDVDKLEQTLAQDGSSLGSVLCETSTEKTTARVATILPDCDVGR